MYIQAFYILEVAALATICPLLVLAQSCVPCIKHSAIEFDM